jgi:hypothetical protein
MLGLRASGHLNFNRGRKLKSLGGKMTMFMLPHHFVRSCTVDGALPTFCEALPPFWNGPHVGQRLADALATLELLPFRDYTGYRSARLSYIHDTDDLRDQEQDEPRVRLSPHEITRAIETSYWPARYLGARDHELRVAVNAVAKARSRGLDAASVARERGGTAAVWRDRHDRGCEVIAVLLNMDQVPVS